MAAVIASPTTGSAQRQPSAAPPADSNTAAEVIASVRACSPSATSAAEPMRRPVRRRTCAAISLPAAPTSPASATAHRNRTSDGSASRRIDSYPAKTAEARITSTTTMPATSSARP